MIWVRAGRTMGAGFVVELMVLAPMLPPATPAKNIAVETAAIFMRMLFFMRWMIGGDRERTVSLR